MREKIRSYDKHEKLSIYLIKIRNELSSYVETEMPPLTLNNNFEGLN